MQKRILIASNLRSDRPFGQFTRPFCLGDGLRLAGWDVGHVAIRTNEIADRVDWHHSTEQASVRAFVRGIAAGIRAFEPDIVYCHQNLPASAGLVAMARRRDRVVADFHSLPSVEWTETATYTADSRQRLQAQASWAKTTVIERLICRSAGHLVAAGSEVREDMQRKYRPRSAVLQVNNGVLIRPFVPISPDVWGHGEGADVVATIPRETSPANEAALLLLGEVASLVAPAGVRVHVIGSVRPDGDTSPLNFHGVVAAVEPWLAAADACILPYPAHPALAGGARTKLLEGLAYAKRLITTDEGLRGFRDAATWPGVYVSDDVAPALAETIVRAMDSHDRLPPIDSQATQALTWIEHSKILDAYFSKLLA